MSISKPGEFLANSVDRCTNGFKISKVIISYVSMTLLKAHSDIWQTIFWGMLETINKINWTALARLQAQATLYNTKSNGRILCFCFFYVVNYGFALRQSADSNFSVLSAVDISRSPTA